MGVRALVCGGCYEKANGSMDRGGACVVLVHGSPEIVGGADSTCSVRAGISTSMHCCGGPP